VAVAKLAEKEEVDDTGDDEEESIEEPIEDAEVVEES
jgi:hypothetical protein